MSTIKIGDTVTWRSRPNALGITGCKVVELGEDEHGNRAAMIEVGMFSTDGRPVGALLEHLHREGLTDE